MQTGFSFFTPLNRWLIGLVAALATTSALGATFKLKIEGVDDALKDNVRVYLERWDSLPDTDSSAFQQRLENTVRTALQPLGYYEPSISYTVSAEKLSLSINPGPPIRWGVSNVSVPIETDHMVESLQKALMATPFKTGEVINHSVYDSYKKTILSQVQQHGFLDARWQTSKLQIDIENHEARALLIMAPGPRYRLKDIVITGTQLNDKTVHNLINLETGQWYDADDFGTAYQDLLGSGYFKYANFNLKKSQPGEANLNVELTEQPRDHYSTGIGYGTDTGPRAKLGWRRNRVNKRGDSLSMNLQVSGIGEELTSEYRIPWYHPLDRYISWNTGYQHEDLEDQESKLLTTGINFNRVKQRNWQYRYGINLENESYRQGSKPEENVTYLLPNFSYRKSTNFSRDDGSRLASNQFWFSSAYGHGLDESELRFVSVDIGTSLTLNLSQRNSIATRLELAAIETDDFSLVPVTKRYYTGGDQTVRGFKYETLAPEDSDGELIGGQYLNVASMEYRYEFIPKWKLATFVDTGRAYIDDNADFHTGAGVGVRWDMPVGMLAFDVARPISDEAPEDDKLTFHLYLSMVL